MILIQLLAFAVVVYTQYKIPYLKRGKKKKKIRALVVQRTEVSVSFQKRDFKHISDIIQVTTIFLKHFERTENFNRCKKQLFRKTLTLIHFTTY